MHVYIHKQTQTDTHTHTYAAEAVSSFEPRLAGGHDEEQEILVKNAELLAVV